VGIAKINIIEHTYNWDNMTRVPTHRLSMVNNTDRILEYITVQFDYYDKDNNLITRFTVETRTPMLQNTQNAFNNIGTGVMKRDFARSTATIIKARFQ